MMVHPVFGRCIGLRWRHLRALLRHDCSVEHDRVESHASNGKTGVVIEDESDDVGEASGADSTVCTAIDNDWGDARPNMLMHPPCACPRCAPDEEVGSDERSWLQLYGRTQRMWVEAAELGETGRALLG
jgi:hypothetical protein